MSTGDAEERAHLERLRATHQERLRALEIQAAEFGRECPASITIEINGLKRKVADLRMQLQPPSPAERIKAVRHPTARGFLERAIAAQQAGAALDIPGKAGKIGEYLDAAGEAAAALLWSLNQVRPVLSGWRAGWETSLFPFRDTPEARQQQMTFLQALGLDYLGYMRVDDLIGVVILHQGSTEVIVQRIGAMPRFTADNAAFVIEYCIHAVLRIEEQAGNLDAPFGIPVGLRTVR